MIGISFADIDFAGELTEIVKLFFEESEFEVLLVSPSLEETGLFLYGRMEAGEEPSYVIGLADSGKESLYRIRLTGGLPERADIHGRKSFKREVRRGVYVLLSRHTGRALPWGMLTGIRPAKIVHELLDEGVGSKGIDDRLTGYFLVSPEKAGLLYEVALAERTVLGSTPANTVSLYVGIPFCATRCLYCSFASNIAGRTPGFLEKYVEALKKEIRLTASLLEDRRLKVQNIYIGGGTPTVLDTSTLKGLLDFIGEHFDPGGLQEYTIEAGRPDSLDMEKLLAIRDSSANRISINPQTMNDATLKLIGRNHSADDVSRAFGLAREAGFDNINMDIIMGLPGEDAGMFEHTLEQISGMCPESLTVHALAVKRASGLADGRRNMKLVRESEAEAMMDLAVKYACEMGLHPYYLYRQKNITGNLENTGFCKPGCEGLYNIQIMEEKQSIIAVGAGAVTKVVYREEDRIERAFNVKNVEEYINRTDEMFERKRKLLGPAKNINGSN